MSDGPPLSVRVLVVDDDPDFADLTATFLQRHDAAIEVETATSAEEGLARLADHDCVVSDYDMPGMDGLAFLDAVREERPDMPFILFTGAGSEEIASRAISAGVTDYLQKRGGTEQYDRLANRIVHATTARRAEREAAETRAHLQTIVESATDAILTVDASSTIQFANESVESVFGYAPEEVIGEPLTMLMPDRYRDRHLDAVQQYLETGERRRDWALVEFPGLHREGHEVPLSISFGTFVRDGERQFTGVIRDVSEREERERELAMKNKAMDETAVGIVITDPSRPDNPIVYANEGFEELTGYSRTAIRGQNCRLLQGPETDPEPVAEMRSAIDEERPVSVEVRNYRADGTPFWNRVHITPITDESGAVTNFVGFLHDVTDRKRRERALSRYETLVESLDDAAWMVDEDGVLTFVNRSVVDQLDRPREHLVGRHFTDVLLSDEVLPRDVVETFERGVEAVLRGERDVVQRELTLSRDGVAVVHDVRVVPVQVEGETAGAVGLNRDVTEQKRLRSELEKVFGRITDAFFGLDEEWRFTYVNDRAEALLGRSREDLLGTSVWEAFEEAEDLAFYEQYHRAMESQEPVFFEEYYPPLSTWFSVRVYPSETGLSVYFRDVTERKRREERLAGLNEMLADFLQADDRVGLCTAAVEAASDLDLPATTVALFEDGTGTLRPVANTPLAREHLDVSALLDQQSGLAWEAFTAGERVVVDDPDADLVDPALSATHLLIYPLGKHGVFVAAVDVPGHVADVRGDFVETVVGNLRGALDRIEREELLREREERLEEQNEWLDRLNRINDVIRRIDQVLVGAATDEEIEETVCEELVSAGPYRFAWIGEYDAAADRIESREHAGDGPNVPDADTPSLTDASGENPTARASRSRESIVVADVLTEPPLAPWRKAALDRGFRSCIAIPLRYRDRLYGVLTVYADSPEAFDDLEREVLTELGETIAYAINSIESKRALVSDEVVELEFEIDPAEIPSVEVIAEAGRKCALEGIVPAADGTFRAFFTIWGASPDVVDRLERSPCVRECELVADREAAVLVECTVTPDNFLAWLLDHAAVPNSLSIQDGASVTVQIPRSADVRNFVELLQEAYPGTRLVARRERERTVQTRQSFQSELEDRLTPRQQEILRTAYFSGYFDTPRKRTGQDIAASVGITQPTFSDHLRSGLRKLLGMLYDEESDAPDR
ncbi:MAG: PAS domain S-box protein [Haloarculaceae archaeon]